MLHRGALADRLGEASDYVDTDATMQSLVATLLVTVDQLEVSI